MRFISPAGMVALAALTAASTISSSSDLDSSVWQRLSSIKERSFTPHRRNRPTKRQSGWSPPSELATPLKQVWDHCLETYSDGDLFGFKNYGWDQVKATSGSINMCVRWESSSSVTEAQRTQVATVLNEQYQKWFKWLYGFDDFPYAEVSVNVVGWAVRDKSLLQGSTGDIDVYTDTDDEGIPQCATTCGRMFNQDGDYSNCANGADRHYDQSLWLTDGLEGGTGGDWGQRIGKEYFMEALGSSNIHILLHEMGHTFGLDDFYDWTPTGISNFIMLAGSSTEITDFDGWMLRNWWYELSRNRGWQSESNATKTQVATTTSLVPQQSTLVISSVASSQPTIDVDPSQTISEAAPAQTTEAGGDGGDSAGKWEQCGGGSSYTGPTQCSSGLDCTKHNEYYWQCL
ncbi:Fc.00g095710.m01.CDS01 [Cosmosporella sp. VM-42]